MDSVQISKDEPANDVPVILNVGRLVRAKNQELLIRALAEIESACKLIIVGDGHKLAELKILAENLGVEGKIQFVTQSTEMSEWFSQADIFALSSSYEGLPLTVIEAMSCRLPVVATDVGGIGELYQRLY